MQTVAQAWLVYRLTGSAVWLGFVGFSSQIPVFLLAPVGGSVADRYNRRRILVATQTAAMLLAFLLAALTLRSDTGVARLSPRRPPGRGQCLRHPDPAGLCRWTWSAGKT